MEISRRHRGSHSLPSGPQLVAKGNINVWQQDTEAHPTVIESDSFVFCQFHIEVSQQQEKKHLHLVHSQEPPWTHADPRAKGHEEVLQLPSSLVEGGFLLAILNVAIKLVLLEMRERGEGGSVRATQAGTDTTRPVCAAGVLLRPRKQEEGEDKELTAPFQSAPPGFINSHNL